MHSVIPYAWSSKGVKETDHVCCFQVREASTAAKQIDLEGKLGHIIGEQFYGQHSHRHHGKFPPSLLLLALHVNFNSILCCYQPSTLDNLLLNSNESFLYTGKLVKYGGVPDSILDGWDLVERQVLPPPPSQAENVAQWERAMYAGTKKK